MIPRLYWPQPLHVGQRLSPEEAVQRYLLRTLRLAPGAPVVLFTGLEEGEWQAVLVNHASIQIEVLTFSPCQRESPLAITLVQGVSKPDAMELTIQKAVELGVFRIIPLLCRRSSSNANSELTTNRRQRLHRIAIEAAEQCGRTRVPELAMPLSWTQLGIELPPGPRWLFWEERPTQSPLRHCPPPGAAVTLLVGPEGGLDPWEESFAREQLGFVTLGLGPRILRTATAALTVVAVCQSLWGDMGGAS
ncbi:MAG: 16S rRNA (uracil(1498)-N(3))-methyltransferase [Magnetococcales bacterium]|nr:16S rRNA (uracil(1498)-N(3))-methyltransferase [Magnetococcales bacterium]